MTYACSNGHDVGQRRFILVRCEHEGCTARITYEPTAHGLHLSRELREAHETLKRAVGCKYPDTCGGPLSQPICKPCIDFAKAHLWTTAPDPIDVSSTPETREVKPKTGRRRGPLPGA